MIPPHHHTIVLPTKFQPRHRFDYIFFPCITHVPSFVANTMDTASCPIVAGALSCVFAGRVIAREDPLARADAIAGRAYAPYSRFDVGCAVLTRDGTVMYDSIGGQKYPQITDTDFNGFIDGVKKRLAQCAGHAKLR